MVFPKKSMPNLLRAYEIQKKAAKVGFDWQEITPALEKVKEELVEFENEINKESLIDAKKEFGDILFAFVNVARFLKIIPEEHYLKPMKSLLEGFVILKKK